MLPLKAQAKGPDIRFCMDLCPAEGEDVEEKGFQDELKKLFHDLRAVDVDVSPSYYFIDTVYGGGGLSGEFFLPALGKIAAPVTAVLGVFFQARTGRKVRVRIGEIDVVVESVEDVKGLLTQAGKYWQDAGE